MNNRFRFIAIALIIFFSYQSFSQTQVLSLQQAIAIGLKNNFQILIAKNEKQIAHNNNSLGNAGFLPELNVNASYVVGDYAVKQKMTTDVTPQNLNNVTDNINAAVSFSWTLFDGTKMFVLKEKNTGLEAYSELLLKNEIETSVAKIITAYFDVVRQIQLLKAMNESLELSKERERIAKTQFDIGTSSKVDYLQATVDLNAEKSAILSEEDVLNSSKITLYQLLIVSLTSNYSMADTILSDYHPMLDDLLNTAHNQNTNLLLAKQSLTLSKLFVKEMNSARLPKLVFTSNYVFSKSDNTNGIPLLYQNVGPNYGLTVTMPIFNGFNLETQSKNAKIEELNSEYKLNDAQLQIDALISKTFSEYQSYSTMVEMEKDNIKVARENMNVAMERFRLGASNSIELRQAQQAYEDAVSRLITAQYNTKIAETNLLLANGSLVK